jgi:hypothetical protein
VLSNVVRSKQKKGHSTSTDGKLKLRKFTRGAEVDLEFVVEKHAEDIANGKKFVDRRGNAVLACVFHSLPTEELSAGFVEGRMYERKLISWTREQSCKDLNRNRRGFRENSPGSSELRGVGVVHRRPDGRSSLGASRGAKQARGLRFGPGLLRAASLASS